MIPSVRFHRLAAPLLFGTLAFAALWGVRSTAQEPMPEGSSAAPASAVEPPAQPSPTDPAAIPTTAPAAKPPVPRPLRPGLKAYDVGVYLTFADDPRFSPQLRQEVAAGIREELESRAGAFWRPLEVREADQALRIAPIRDDRAVIERLAPELKRRTSDKIFLAAIDAVGGEFAVRVAEWDRSSASLGVWVRETVTDRRLLAANVTRLVGNTFRPLATIESVDGQTAVLELRAAELAPPDPRFLPIQEGDSLQPFLRFLTRTREVDRIQAVPWTYLLVEEVDRSRAVCRVISSFKSPLPAGRRRMELMAVGATPVYEQTTLEIAPHGNPQNPVVGARVELLDRLPTKEDTVEDRVITTTDRFGRVSVPVDPLKPLVWVYVFSGKSVLARVPIVPGLVPMMSLSVPDDAPRLMVEGELSLLEGELIDVVGRREVLMARARQIVKSNRWDEIEKLTTQVEDLPAIAEFERRADAVRIAGIQAARNHQDKIAEARIGRLVAGFLALVKEHLDPEKITAFKDEMAELRRVQ